MTIPTEELLAHRAFVDRLARDLAADPEGASDLSQETWVRMLERGPAHGTALRAWLSRVAPRLAQRGAERDASRRARERAAARPEAEGEPASSPADRSAVLEAVQGLREPYRSAVLLRYYEDLPPAAIAKRLGQPVDTVKTRLKRALRTLRADLGRSAADGRLLGFAPKPCFPDPPRMGSAATPLGGLFVGTKVAVGAVVGAALLSGLILFLRSGGEAPRAGVEPLAESAQPPGTEERPSAELAASASPGGGPETAPAGGPKAAPDRRAAAPSQAKGQPAEAPPVPRSVPATDTALVVRGRVFHLQGDPAPGATVVLGRARAQTDARGAFALPLEHAGTGPIDGSLDPDTALVAVLGGFAPAVLPGFGAVAEERARSKEQVELVLPGEAGAIGGFLLDAGGAPAVGWRIKVLDGTIVARTAFFPVSAEALAAEPEAVLELGDGQGLAATLPALMGFQETEEEGRFRFAGLSVDRTYRLRAWNPHTLECVESEPLPTGTEDCVLRVPGTPPRAFVDGVVVGTDGSVLAGVRCRLTMVEHESGGASWMTTGQELTTGADGTFVFHDVPHTALFVRFDLEAGSTELTLEPGSEYHGVRVVIERLGGFRFESLDPPHAPDHVAVEDDAGQRLLIGYTLGPGLTASVRELPVQAGASPAGLVHESARLLVLLKDGEEIGRASLLVRPGEVALVRR